MRDIHRNRLLQSRIVDLIDDVQSHRNERLRLRVSSLYADFSRCRLDSEAILWLQQRSPQLSAAIGDLFGGVAINRSEDRAVLHTLLRTPAGASLPDSLAEHAAAIAQARTDMAAWTQHLREEGFANGRALKHIINVGIGGSDLGPRLLLDVIAADSAAPQVHFLSSVDGHALELLMRSLDPAETLVVLVSKSFATRETLMHGQALLDWLNSSLGRTHAAEHVFAVTARAQLAIRFGVRARQILPLWDWVGGRYSVWSAVSFSAVLRVGIDAFDAFLAGAHEMDTHFQQSELAVNLPVLAGLVGDGHRNLLGYSSLCVMPYDPRLKHLPNYLQQLEMESNGKSTRFDGSEVEYSTAPVIWGGVGTDSQHAFFQALHQGTEVSPVDFIGVVQPDHAFAAHHQSLLANLLAQSEALAIGTPELRDVDPHRFHPGNRPSAVYLLDALTPRTLGLLLALYEHKVFVQSQLWGINAFDQWGVELGKKMATKLEDALRTGSNPPDADPTTLSLLAEIRARSV